MVLSIMVPHIPAFGTGGMPLVPPTILMSAIHNTTPQEAKEADFQYATLF